MEYGELGQKYAPQESRGVLGGFQTPQEGKVSFANFLVRKVNVFFWLQKKLGTQLGFPSHFVVAIQYSMSYTSLIIGPILSCCLGRRAINRSLKLKNC